MLTAIRLSIVLLVICGGLYPAVVVGAGQLLFHDKAEGSIIQKNGNTVGSALIAQAFDKPQYFHPRPSAAGADGYDSTASAGSNLGPTNKKLIDRATDDTKSLKDENPGLRTIPADLVTTSGSGLDPDISPDGAMAQVPRVAKARNLPESRVTDLVNSHIIGRDLGLFGEPRVNVLQLNLDLDGLK
jgi:K+-transporting ATPase ATPase C chain